MPRLVASDVAGAIDDRRSALRRRRQARRTRDTVQATIWLGGSALVTVLALGGIMDLH